jgi:hypothetical protein
MTGVAMANEGLGDIQVTGFMFLHRFTAAIKQYSGE